MERTQELRAAARSIAVDPLRDAPAAALAMDPMASQISNADLLRYVGDMVEELQYMCQRTGCTTLQGLLALARAEAMLQQRAVPT